MKNLIKTPHAPKAVGPYNQAVEINGMLFVSGQVGLRPDDNVMVEGGIAEQTEQVLKNIGSILQDAGYTTGDVMLCTCMLTDLKNFNIFNEIYSDFFPADSPARQTFEASALPIGALVEISCIAVKH